MAHGGMDFGGEDKTEDCWKKGFSGLPKETWTIISAGVWWFESGTFILVAINHFPHAR